MLTYLSRMEQSFPLVQRTATSLDSALSTQQRPTIALPSPPTPDATPRQVRQFFKQCFLAHRTELSEEQAEEESTLLSVKVRLAGTSLYMLSKETLVATFGAEGEVIHNIVQSGKFGSSLSYSLSFLGAALRGLGFRVLGAINSHVSCIIAHTTSSHVEHRGIFRGTEGAFQPLSKHAALRTLGTRGLESSSCGVRCPESKS